MILTKEMAMSLKHLKPSRMESIMKLNIGH